MEEPPTSRRDLVLDCYKCTRPTNGLRTSLKRVDVARLLQPVVAWPRKCTEKEDPRLRADKKCASLWQEICGSEVEYMTMTMRPEPAAVAARDEAPDREELQDRRHHGGDD